jgi:hypothetical protein
MKTVTKTILLILLILPANFFSQNHPLLNSEHIPLIGFDVAAYDPINWEDFDYKRFEDMGLDGFIFGFQGTQFINQIMYDKFQNINDKVKLIPMMSWGEIDFIQRYTESIYTKWEAADTANSSIKAALEFDSSIAQRYNSNEIITDSGAAAGRLIWGPGYRQSIRYKIGDTSTINYTAKFRLKITKLSQNLNPEDPVCTIQVMFKRINPDTSAFIDSVSIDRILKITDFPGEDWAEFDIDYKLWLNQNFLYKPINPRGQDPYRPPNFARYVEFIVE